MTKSKNQKILEPLFIAGLEFQDTIKKNNWSFCFIGGLAVIRWGEIRITQDVDICLLCGFGNEEKYIKTLLEIYNSRISDAYNFALTNRVLLLYASNDVSIDIALSGLTFEEQMMKNATTFLFDTDCSLLTCSAEDLIVLKTFANRMKDWMDVEGIIIHQGNNLDMIYILEQLAPLCEMKGMPEIITKLENLFNKIL